MTNLTLLIAYIVSDILLTGFIVYLYTVYQRSVYYTNRLEIDILRKQYRNEQSLNSFKSKSKNAIILHICVVFILVISYYLQN